MRAVEMIVERPLPAKYAIKDVNGDASRSESGCFRRQKPLRAIHESTRMRRSGMRKTRKAVPVKSRNLFLTVQADLCMTVAHFNPVYGQPHGPPADRRPQGPAGRRGKCEGPRDVSAKPLPRPISRARSSKAAIRFSVAGWVENKLSIRAPDNGLMMKRWAVAGFISAEGFSMR